MNYNCYTTNKVVIFFLFFLFNSVISLGQSQWVIQGEIDNFKENPDDYFNVFLLSVRDSSLIKGGAFTNGLFKIEIGNTEEKQFILRITSLQYAAKDTILQIKDTFTDLGTIYLEENRLHEITVTAKKPIMTNRSGILKLDIQNSFLKDAGNLLDVLKKAPGLFYDQGIIKVFGKGIPIIYINDKEVRSQEELSALSSRDIDNIEIDRNPSAEHSASGFAIIKITTRKKLQDFLGMEVSNQAMLGRRFSDGINFNVSAKSKKISNYLSYSYNDESYLQHDKASESIFYPEGNFLNRRQTDLSGRDKYHSFFYSMDYDLDSKNTLGFQYLGNFAATNQKLISDQIIEEFDKEAVNRDINVGTSRQNHLHNLSLNYKLNLNTKSSVVIISDYSFSNRRQHQNITEKNRFAGLPTESVSEYDDHFSVFGIKAELTSEIAGIDYKAGVKYAAIEDKGWYEFNHTRHSNNLSDKVSASFISAKKSFGTFSITAGIRGEYTETRVKTNEDKENDIDTCYYNLFPNVKIVKNISENSDLTFSYSRRISRPGFRQISPRFTYIDSLSNMIGNPRLLPAFSDVTELSYSYSNISLSIGYRIDSRFIAQIGTTTPENPNVVQHTFINLKNAEYWSGNAEYSFSKSHVSGYAGIYFLKPFVNIDFLGQQYKVRKPLAQFQAGFNYSILKNTALYGTFDYRTAGEYETSYLYESTDLALGIRQYLINKKLSIAIEFTDILKTATPNNWKSQFNNIVSIMRTNADSRTGILKVSYNFGNLKGSSKKKSSNEEERNRL